MGAIVEQVGANCRNFDRGEPQRSLNKGHKPIQVMHCLARVKYAKHWIHRPSYNRFFGSQVFKSSERRVTLTPLECQAKLKKWLRIESQALGSSSVNQRKSESEAKTGSDMGRSHLRCIQGWQIWIDQDWDVSMLD